MLPEDGGGPYGLGETLPDEGPYGLGETLPDGGPYGLYAGYGLFGFNAFEAYPVLEGGAYGVGEGPKEGFDGYGRFGES